LGIDGSREMNWDMSHPLVAKPQESTMPTIETYILCVYIYTLYRYALYYIYTCYDIYIVWSVLVCISYFKFYIYIYYKL
jgi:hypothetical protein